MTAICQVSTSHLSIKSNTKFFWYQPRGKQEEQFGLKTSRTFITFEKRLNTSTILVIFILQIYALHSKVIYSLTKEPYQKNQLKKNGKIPIIFRWQNLKISLIENQCPLSEAEKHLCWSIFLIKFQSFRSATFLKSKSNKGIFR